MARIGEVIAEALKTLAPQYKLVEGEVISWYPKTALVRTRDGRVIRATNPLGSRADKAKVLVAISRDRDKLVATIVGVR